MTALDCRVTCNGNLYLGKVKVCGRRNSLTRNIGIFCVFNTITVMKEVRTYGRYSYIMYCLERYRKEGNKVNVILSHLRVN